MKKGLLSTLMIAAIGFTSEAQVPKTPFIEHFTQASCGPCASQNPALKVTLDNFGTANYVKVTHQTSWPGVDPMNAEYPAGPNDRRVYYGVTGVPDASLNGGPTNSPNSVVTTNSLNAMAAQTTPYDLTITQTWAAIDTVTVNVVVTNTTATAVSTANKLYVAMLENYIYFPTPPGSNGETEFYYVMRQMYDASSGTPTTAGLTIGAIPANGTLSYSFTLAGTQIPSYIRDLNELSFAAYLQTQSTKEIHQAAKSQAGNVPGLLSVASQASSTVGAGYCSTSFDPIINFTNNGSDPITSVTAEYSIDGGTPVSQTFTGNLTQGQSTAITFANINLAAGISNVTYNITDINNGATYSPGNVAMGDEVYYKLKATATAAPVSAGFETAPLITGTGYARATNNVILESSLANNLFSVLNGPSYGYGAIGGFSQSNRSIRFRSYYIAGGNEGNVVMEKVNLQNDSKISYSYAHQQYTGFNERLDIEVSTDCGATWTTVSTKVGAQLASITPSTTTLYDYPTAASQWATDTVSLVSFDNTNDVIVRFKLTSGGGNNLFIDDLNIMTSTATNIAAVENAAVEMNIMPNPVRDYMTVIFTMEEMTDATISVVNALGQQVQQVASQSFEGVNNLEVNTSQLTTGVYFLNITSEKGTSTKRFVVEK